MDTIKNLKTLLKDNIKLNKFENKSNQTDLFILIIFMIIYILGFLNLATSSNYKELFNNKINKYLIIFNIFISIIITIIISIFLYYNREILIIFYKYNPILKYCFFILIYIFIFYIISIFNFIKKINDKENQNEYDFFTNYYIFIEFLLVLFFIIYMFMNKKINKKLFI